MLTRFLILGARVARPCPKITVTNPETTSPRNEPIIMFRKTLEATCLSIALTLSLSACGGPTVQYNPQDDDNMDAGADMTAAGDMQTPSDMSGEGELDMGPPPECVEDADCETELPNVSLVCNAGTCEVDACQDGFAPDPGDEISQAGCTCEVQEEMCGDGVDNNCDGIADEGCPCDFNDLSEGVCSMATRDDMGVCTAPSTYEEADISCDGVDNDCDGEPDDDCVPIQITSGTQHTCELRADGEVTCWGNAFEGRTSPPAGVLFASIDAGADHTCGIVKEDNSIRCWGSNNTGQLDAPGGQFIAVSSGYQHSCAITMEGSATCWGAFQSGQSTPPGESFKQISAGVEYSCGVTQSGDAMCWGSNSFGQATPPQKKFKQVSAGVTFSCGILEDDKLECWGRDQQGTLSPPTSETYQSVTVGVGFGCAVDTSGIVSCWGGDNLFGERDAPATVAKAVSALQQHTCLVTEDGATECWGLNDYGQAIPPAGTYTLVDAGEGHFCALRDDERIECWGFPGSAVLDVPTNKFSTFSASFDHGCGIDEKGDVNCWGDNSFGQLMPADFEGNPVIEVTTGDNFSCARLQAGVIKCWGDDRYGQTTSPTGGTFTSIDAAKDHVCAGRGIQLDCWGRANPGNVDVQTGEYTQVAVGRNSTCGLDDNGNATCVGDISGAPAGKFKQIAVGANKACALEDATNAIVCWDDSVMASNPVEGEFMQISMRGLRSAALRMDGSLVFF